MMKEKKYILTLYIAGLTQKAKRAIDNIQLYCNEYLQDDYTLEILDLREYPELAVSEQIVALPTLIRWRPEPTRKLVGDLSDKEKVLIGLNIKPG